MLYVCSACTGRKTVSDPLELGSCDRQLWVLETELRSSAEHPAPKCWTISAARPGFIFFLLLLFLLVCNMFMSEHACIGSMRANNGHGAGISLKHPAEQKAIYHCIVLLLGHSSGL